MRTWNHRVCKKNKAYVDFKGNEQIEVIYEIHEVHYNNGEICAITENAIPAIIVLDDDMSEEQCLEALRETLLRMTRSLDKEIVDIQKQKFSSM